MEALYSKLYDKYTKLKDKKLSDFDQINKAQEAKFMNFMSAADELMEHLKSENNQLLEKVNDLRSEVAAIRHAFSALSPSPSFFFIACFDGHILFFSSYCCILFGGLNDINLVRLVKDKEVADYQRLVMEADKKSETLESLFDVAQNSLTYFG